MTKDLKDASQRKANTRNQSRFQKAYKQFKKFVSRYVLIWPILAYLAGLCTQLFEYKLKTRSSTFEQIKLESDLLDKIQSINKELQDNTIAYNTIRNEYYNNASELDLRSKNRLKMEYSVTKGKMLQLCEEYNLLQTHIASIENVKPHFYVFGLDLWVPAKIIQTLKSRKHLANDTSGMDANMLEVFYPLPQRDPLIVEASSSLSNLFSVNGYSYPSDRGWHDANYDNYFLTNVELSVYTKSDLITNGNTRMWVEPDSNGTIRIGHQVLPETRVTQWPVTNLTNTLTGQR